MNYFSLFSTEHILTIGAFLVFTFVLLVLSRLVSKRTFTVGLAFSVVALKIAETVVRHGLYNEDVLDLLPIHLCNLTLVLCLISLFNPSKSLFQLIYYWSPGALAAILFPEIRYTFPNFIEISFFAIHFFIIFVILYQIIFFKFRPTLKGLFNSFIFVNIFAAIVYKINICLGTNYMYINYKPAFSSPLDLFGPWPHYIIIVEIIYLVIGILLYLPFKKRHYKYSNI